MIDFKAICNGILLPIEEVDDPVFSEKMMGDGLAFCPASSTILAPISGEITFLYPTGHALGICDDNGVEVLIHVGLGSFKMANKAITAKVKVGDRVKSGDVLLEVDIACFKKQGIDSIIPVVFTKGHRVKLLKSHQQVVCGETGIVEISDL